MRMLFLLGLFLALASSLYAVDIINDSITPITTNISLNLSTSVITINSTVPCSTWTGWAPFRIQDAPIYDMTYKRDCDNVTYISYCLSTPVYVNFSHARFYTGVSCPRKDFCQGWTRFYPETSKNLTERTPANMTRVCTNTTFVSWCIREHSNIDYRTGRRYSQMECTDWSQACYLKPSSSLLKFEEDGDQCRLCNQTTYNMICNFGNRISTGKSQIDSVCGAWDDCAVLRPSRSARYSNYTSAPVATPVGLDPSILLAALLAGVALTIMLVLMFSGKSE